ncbi:polysaccharide biosynthesis tyrosine autokinase [Colwellia sp. E2M01]|uniref:GumC family protein n=1 Tax=Colwellia sp. E2M01 TaxID=2841561 RepID=UPI001C09121E|nr:polysaccharide biosynthesis tyrosine autokinase [Colwellia sp. E2M01]MBU2870042.1 polysaccharide biosynthesis tyrosine autokinase [Colwellia sp. E2M01]
MNNTENLPLDGQKLKQVSTEEIIDIRYYISVINKNKWRIGFLAFAAALFAAMMALKITPTYKATSTLLIEADQAKAVSFEEIYGLDSNRKEYYLTQFEILKSRTVAQAVVEQLDLKNHPDFIGKPSFISNLVKDIKKGLPFIPEKKVAVIDVEEQEEQQLQSLVKSFLGRLSIDPVRKTQLVNISFQSSDPKLAALVANTVGEVYIEQNLAAKMGMTQKAAGWLTTRLSGLRLRLDESESKLQKYRESENLIDVTGTAGVTGVLGLVSNELSQTSQQLVVERQVRNKLLNIVRIIDEYGRDNLEMLSSINEITSHNTIQNVKSSLVNVELKVSELSQVYGPKHPKMIAAKAELVTVQNNLSAQIRKLITGVEKELTTSERNINALERELVRIKAQYQTVTAKEYEYKKLSREVETNRTIYDTFFSRSKETEVTSDFNSAVARFTDRAYTPVRPTKPNKPLIVILAFMATAGFGIVIAFVFDALNDTFKNATEIESKLSQRLLGMLPLVRYKKKAGFMLHYFFDESGKKFAESVRTLRTSFVLTQLDKEAKTIGVTSSIPGEGKSTTATNLAFSLAQVERTILIDADMRKPSLCKRFDIASYHPGLANFIAGTAELDECIFKDEKSGLMVMPCGQRPPNPLELLSSPRFVELLEKLKESYDRILIDTPPVQSVSDALVIAQQTDTIVYVVKSDDTRIGTTQEGIGRLIRVNAKIAGIVLNYVDTKKLSESDSHQGYYNEYTYGDNDFSDESYAHSSLNDPKNKRSSDMANRNI